jgi:hypothetical protein
MTVLHYLPLPKPPLGQPCRVTFRSATSEDDQGSPKAIAVSVTADDGDYQGSSTPLRRRGAFTLRRRRLAFFSCLGRAPTWRSIR